MNGREKELARAFFNANQRFSQMDSKARYFGTAHRLSLAEIHLIDYIGYHTECFANDIARDLGVTKGAVSQTMRRLVELGYIVRTPDVQNKSRLLLSLTAEGERAFLEHQKYHQEIERYFAQLIETYSQEEYEKMLQLLQRLEGIFEQSL